VQCSWQGPCGVVVGYCGDAGLSGGVEGII
jgi:hypothetical protein